MYNIQRIFGGFPGFVPVIVVHNIYKYCESDIFRGFILICDEKKINQYWSGACGNP